MTKLRDGKLCNALWEETVFDLVKSSHIFMDGMSFWRFGISITYSHWCILERMTVFSNCFVITNMTAQKWSKDFFSKWNQIHRKLRIWSHLLNNSLMENFIFVQCIFNLLIFLKVFQICVSNVLLNLQKSHFFSKSDKPCFSIIIIAFTSFIILTYDFETGTFPERNVTK